jgi:hypothetical protein
MTSQILFKEFVNLFKSWPVDASKSGRCLGEYLRKEFTRTFREGELSENVNVTLWKKRLDDLLPIANNEYAKKYKRQKEIGSLGLGREQCRLVMSNDGLKFMSERE